MLQAGTAVSSRTRPEAPNSVNILRWGEALGAAADLPQAATETGVCLIERWDFTALNQAFTRASVALAQPERT